MKNHREEISRMFRELEKDVSSAKDVFQSNGRGEHIICDLSYVLQSAQQIISAMAEIMKGEQKDG